MYNSYMSEKDFKKLKSGDEVTVRILDDLIHDFGTPIDVPCGWNSDMNELCGMTLVVRAFDPYSNCIRFWDYDWGFSREMLEPHTHNPSISIEEISKLWEKIILGIGENNEKH